MNDAGRWTDGSWYALGSLLIQLGFLVAAVWFARNLFRTTRIFQEQLGALLKLNISAGPTEPRSSTGTTKHTLLQASPYWLMPSESQTSSQPVLTDIRPGRLAIAWHGLLFWLSAPMSPADVTTWRRMINWLQAPAGS
jgi:hypothetical protein